jgi:hypothetical protein
MPRLNGLGPVWGGGPGAGFGMGQCGIVYGRPRIGRFAGFGHEEWTQKDQLAYLEHEEKMLKDELDYVRQEKKNIEEQK